MKRSPPGLMTMAEYSRHRNVNRSYVTRLVQRGILIMRGKLVDVAASDSALDDRPVDVAPEQPAANPPPRRAVEEPAASYPPRQATDSLGVQPAASYAQAKTIDMICRAKLRKLELEARQRKVIDVDVVRAVISDAGRAVRDGILGIPDRLAATLAAESDQKRIHSLLRQELSRELEVLANAIDGI